MAKKKNVVLGFAELMYFYKYVKKLAIECFRVGFKYNANGDICIIPLSIDEFIKYCHGYFEYLSDDNKWYRAEVLDIDVRDDKKHLRLAFQALELKNLAINKLARHEPEYVEVGTVMEYDVPVLIKADDFEHARKQVGSLRNQENRGYATELVILGADWNAYKRGVDIDAGRVEIKYMNGQIEL